MELIHSFALARLASSPAPTAFAHRLPQPTRLPIARSRGFNHAWGTTRWSDDSTRTASHFAYAYRVASLGALRERIESSWGHAMVFGTVPSANTLVRWVNELRLRPHSAGSTLPHLWPTCSSSGSPPLITARYFSSDSSDSGSLRTPCPPPACAAGRQGITPAFGYSAPHPSAGATLTLPIHALPSTPYGPVRLPPMPPPEATLRPLSSHQTGLPRLLGLPSDVPCPLP